MAKLVGTFLGAALLIAIGYVFAVVAGGSFNPFEWNWFVRILAGGWLASWLIYAIAYGFDDLIKEEQ